VDPIELARAQQGDELALRAGQLDPGHAALLQPDARAR
jgi:hypothetical protein